jgi:hypothetical protein
MMWVISHRGHASSFVSFPDNRQNTQERVGMSGQE